MSLITVLQISYGLPNTLNLTCEKAVCRFTLRQLRRRKQAGPPIVENLEDQGQAVGTESFAPEARPFHYRLVGPVIGTQSLQNVR